ncbi:MAG: MotA/TolQ/ExbB proton channel family protein [Pirellulales bacterium]|nr:MotA/TolQ/ExbB proton channel family protein [Pirellulales bacterium]
MSGSRRTGLFKGIDFPFATAAALTLAFYWFIHQERMRGTLLARYTTEHTVEYVIVSFFIWGITDIVFRLASYPREIMALKHEWLPHRTGRVAASEATALKAQIGEMPRWLRDSRMGQRLLAALTHVEEKGSADEFADYLRSLADEDDERTFTNFGLVRFVAWVTPVLGFLGTVVHFGTALGGMSAGQIADRLPEVVGGIGTGFNTTTAALTAAVTMMFALFLGERTEKGILRQIDRRVERELLNRFEAADANIAPFLGALEATSRASISAIDTAIARQLTIWSQALESIHQKMDDRTQMQVQLWEGSLDRVSQKLDAGDAEREKRFRRILETVEANRTDHRVQLKSTVDQLHAIKQDFGQLAEALTGVMRGEGKLVELQTRLSDNLRLLRETQQIDEAVHGLTAAIHLLTARSHTKDKAA